MPTMSDTKTLKSSPDGEDADAIAYAGDSVTVLQTENAWSEIRRVDPPHEQGWVPTQAVDSADSADAAAGGAAGAAPIDRPQFANSCVLRSLTYNVNPHYLVGVAQLRSGITDGADGERIGPFRLTAVDWAAVTDKFQDTDITSWRMQCAGFALMVQRKMAALGGAASPIDLYMAQWPATDPATIGEQLTQALQTTAELEANAEAQMLDTPAEPDADPPTPAGQFGNAPSGMQISLSAYNLILTAEVTSQAVYNKRYRRPTWPRGKSGITIGIGYDVGYASAEEINNDWQVLGAEMVAQLQAVRGLKGASAQAALGQLANVDVPWDVAVNVHQQFVIPRWVSSVQRALPNTTQLNPDSLGALVSLTYNRGTAIYSLPGDRYSEGRAIRQAMQNENFTVIPGLIRSMSRLWTGPDERGLPIRRENEAKLFMAGMPGGTAVNVQGPV